MKHTGLVAALFTLADELRHVDWISTGDDDIAGEYLSGVLKEAANEIIKLDALSGRHNSETERDLLNLASELRALACEYSPDASYALETSADYLDEYAKLQR